MHKEFRASDLKTDFGLSYLLTWIDLDQDMDK